MTYKQIEASRELRLWIGQVIVPIITVGIAIYSNPEARQAVSNTVHKIKLRIDERMNARKGV